MQVGVPTSRERLGGVLATVVVVAAIGWALLTGLGVSLPRQAQRGLQLFTVAPPPPPPPPRQLERQVRHSAPEGASAPPNLRNRATEVTAPPPIVVLTQPPPPPIVVAPVPSVGAAAQSGATNRPGPGTGAGGDGDGTGSGGEGDGSGAGRAVVPPRQIAGRLHDSDFPKDAPLTGDEGTVDVRYVILPTGRVTDCSIDRTSGSTELDQLTCRLITDRFRYKPARDAEGRPTRATFLKEIEWINEFAGDRAAAHDER